MSDKTPIKHETPKPVQQHETPKPVLHEPSEKRDNVKRTSLFRASQRARNRS